MFEYYKKIFLLGFMITLIDLIVQIYSISILVQSQKMCIHKE